MAGETRTTTDHDTIKQWVEERGGYPARVSASASGGETGILRIDFPGYGDGSALERLSWEDFFETFEEKNLAFHYQDEMRSGDESRFFKLVNRD